MLQVQTVLLEIGCRLSTGALQHGAVVNVKASASLGAIGNVATRDTILVLVVGCCMIS